MKQLGRAYPRPMSAVTRVTCTLRTRSRDGDLRRAAGIVMDRLLDLEQRDPELVDPDLAACGGDGTITAQVTVRSRDHAYAMVKAFEAVLEPLKEAGVQVTKSELETEWQFIPAGAGVTG